MVTILDAAKMTQRGRKQVATWLRRHAALLERLGPQYSKRFTGRYLYR